MYQQRLPEIKIYIYISFKKGTLKSKKIEKPNKKKKMT